MWVNPKYANQAPQQPANPPEEDGQRLATFPRRRRDTDEQMRVSLSEFNGFAYINFRLWTRDASTATWWPVRGKGCSIRASEIGPLIKALTEAQGLIVEVKRDPDRYNGPAVQRPPVDDCTPVLIQKGSRRPARDHDWRATTAASRDGKSNRKDFSELDATDAAEGF
jgi:hypothetical protein